MSSGCDMIQENETLWRVVNSSFSSNTFIQGTGASRECFVVDPGLDSAAVDSALVALNLRPRFICCTHGHFDHLGSAAFLLHKYAATGFMNALDQRTAKLNNFLLLALKLPHRIETPVLNFVSEDNSMISIGAELIRFHLTPGHTPGSCIIEFRNTLFTGDTLLSRGLDVSKFPGGNHTELRASLQRIWNLFPADARVCAGHGMSAEFGWVKVHNELLRRFVGIDCASGDWNLP